MKEKKGWMYKKGQKLLETYARRKYSFDQTTGGSNPIFGHTHEIETSPL